MITEILINNSIVDGELRAVVYPTRGEKNPRVHSPITQASRERIMRLTDNVGQFQTQVHLRGGISFWINRR